MSPAAPTPPSTPPPVADLRRRLDAVTLADADRLRRRLDRLQQRPSDRDLAAVAAQVERAEQLIARRLAARPVVDYPNLPIAARRDDIAAAVAAHQVVIVAGETGSGKTTQLPKICLDLGRGVQGMIGHTQPRRLAARTVAQRIADELHTPLGAGVGFAVRFTDQVSDETSIKLMTDGILLAEIQRDRRLLRYDTLIIDEAHERSLNIDFLLGYLTELLPRRPDLKVLVTSATIDPERFARHFGGAPVIEVSGRTYPVEIRYRPLVPDAEPNGSAAEAADVTDVADTADDPDHEVVHRSSPRDQTEAVVDAVRELAAAGPGDVLVFLSGEREIRDTADALREAGLPDTEVLPLYARLSNAEQQRVFAPHSGRHVVLATNVAETSLTVPGVRYVVDPGTARISRYSRRTKVQRLPIEPISQAAAAQRAGRCGRVADGICIRLYSAADFAARPRFTEPEILRTNLASVILQLTALGLGDIERFPFVEPPDHRSVRDGVMLLQELGALAADGTLTPTGRRLARLPVDPRLGRMILEADRVGCVREIIVLAAALTIPDPRERPADQEAAAVQSHARFADEHSDFIAYLNLWRHLREQRRDLSGNQFRRRCRAEFLNYLRVREWQDLVGQLRTIARSIDITESDTDASPAQIHEALLAGLLSHVGLRTGEGREYQGARNTRFLIAPGSTLSRRPPRWVMAAELVETSRLYGRIAARTEPEQVERLAQHLVTRSYSEPHWDARRGAAMAYERVLLYGLPVVTRRRVNYATADPAVARELFLRHALVDGDWNTPHAFFARNQRLREELADLEERTRRRDVLAGDDAVYAFYDERVPAEVVSSRHFDSWWKRARSTDPHRLDLRPEDLLTEAPPDADEYPDAWRSGDLELPLTYRFEPGSPDDGVTVHVPLDVLARLDAPDLAAPVPAVREDLVVAAIRSLPKDLRRIFVPVPDTARAVLGALQRSDEPFLEALQRELFDRSGALVPLDAFDLDKVPSHLRVTFAVEDDGRELARGKDLAALRSRLTEPLRAAVADAVGADLERSGMRAWPPDLETLPESVERSRAGRVVRGYPALVDEGTTVGLRVLSSPAEQQAATRSGLRRLLRLQVSSPVRALTAGLGPRDRLVLATNPDGSVPALIDDVVDAAVDALMGDTPVADRAGYEALRARVVAEVHDTSAAILRRVRAVLGQAQEVRAALPAHPPANQADAIADIRSQLAVLLPPGFVAATGSARLDDLARYLQAIGRRLDRLPREVDVDRGRMQRVEQVQGAFSQLVSALSAERARGADVAGIRWMIEEFRVSLWAQQLGTSRPVSERRIYRAIDGFVP